MEKNLAGKAFGAQGGPAKAERSAGNMTYEKAKMEIIYLDRDAFVYAAGSQETSGGNRPHSTGGELS